jgi:2',3'-cyclic-nucleotide 2'-phosphodiesterase (5'-nucleotidase family)
MSLPRSTSTALVAGLLGLFAACGGGSVTSGTTAAASGSGTTTTTTPTGTGTVTFVQLGDVHAHLTEHKDLLPDPAVPGATQVVVQGGLARRATLIKTIRQSNAASLVMDLGDTFHGGVEALYTNGDAIVDPMNALGVDVGVPGNWDFAYGPIVTRERYASLTAAEQSMLATMAGVANPTTPAKKPNWTCLAGNITYAMPVAKAGQPFLPATLMKDLGGVRVGIIGISSDIVPKMSSMMAAGLTFLDGEAAHLNLIETQAAALRTQGAQLVVVISHLGIHKDRQLGNDLPKGTVDVFFSGHTHEATSTPIQTTSGALVVEAGHDNGVGRMDITLAQGKIVSETWAILPEDSSVPEDATVAALVATARAPFVASQVNMSVPMPMVSQQLTQPITTVVGQVQGLLHRRNSLENPFNDAFTDALRAYTGAQIAMSPGFRFDAVVGYEDGAVADGSVTLEDLYRFFPAPYTLAQGTIPGATLQRITEQQLAAVFSQNAFNQGGGWLEGYSGLDVNLNLASPDGARISSALLTGTGTALSGAGAITIAGCQRPNDGSDTLCSYTGFTGVTALLDPTTGLAFNPVDFSAQALSSGLLKGSTRKSLVDSSSIAVWPVNPFIQPLW